MSSYICKTCCQEFPMDVIHTCPGLVPLTEDRVRELAHEEYANLLRPGPRPAEPQEPTDDDLRVEAGNAYCADESIDAQSHPCTAYGAGFIAGFRAARNRRTVPVRGEATSAELMAAISALTSCLEVMAPASVRRIMDEMGPELFAFVTAERERREGRDLPTLRAALANAEHDSPASPGGAESRR